MSGGAAGRRREPTGAAYAQLERQPGAEPAAVAVGRQHQRHAAAASARARAAAARRRPRAPREHRPLMSRRMDHSYVSRGHSDHEIPKAL